MPHAVLSHSETYRQKGMPWIRAALFFFFLMPQSIAGYACAQEKPLRKAPVGNPVHLFNSVEFKGSLRALTKWNRILRKSQKQADGLNTCTLSSCECPPGASAWKALLQKAVNMTGLKQLKFVNGYINRWPYRLDMDVYGVSDYWATPQEFLTLSGDCEDYCITKYFVLRELGYDTGNLRVVIIRDRIRNITHAVLAVYLDNAVYIMDNMSNAVFEQEKYKHYIPQYSFNERNRWAHIPLRKKFKLRSARRKTSRNQNE